MKKITSFLLSIVILISIISVSTVSASAASKIEQATYTICSALNNNYVIDVSGGKTADKTNIQLYKSNGTTSQIFEIISVSSGWYKIYHKTSGKVLDVANGSRNSGANIQLYTYNGTDSQLFQFENAGNGYYYIKNKLGNYVDVTKGKVYDGNNIQVYSKNYTASQKWKLTLDLKITTNKIENVLKQYGYTNGKYWTVKETSTKNSDCSKNKLNRFDNCQSSNNASSYNGTYKSYNYENQWECMGFASYVMAKVTKTTVIPRNGNKNGWIRYTKSKSVTSLKVGDIVRFSGHSAIVLSVDLKGNCKFAECWGSKNCKIVINGSFNSAKGTKTLQQLKNKYIFEYVYRYVG